ncbi:MAG: TIGR02300 family protein, partial [Methylobacteriaceae bacterium]|nr:TIGR02300 family protein [Methylobacteriaceae bacterium]
MKPELGGKHKCQNCGTKFFDLNREPIACPKCGTVVQVVGAAKPTPAARAAPAEEEVEVDTAAP